MKKKREFKLWKEFKAFISRGNVLDMAVGVVIGGAFSAIVTALVNILLSVCTWGVPGGLKGLITILPALSASQQGMAGIGQSFESSELQGLAQALAEKNYGAGVEDAVIQATKTEILNQYTLHGTTYVANSAAVIDWGTFINAIISFLIIALTLFIILKVFTTLKAKREAMKKAALEEYYEKHPEERPQPKVEDPIVPQPTELDVLLEIKDLLKNKEEK